MKPIFQSNRNVQRTAKIFEENSNMIRVVIHSQTNDKSSIDDIFQDLFLSLLQSPISPDVENVRGYLKRAIRNDVIDSSLSRKSRRAREQKYADMHMPRIKHDSPADTVAMRDTVEHLIEMIEKKTPHP